MHSNKHEGLFEIIPIIDVEVDFLAVSYISTKMIDGILKRAINVLKI